MSGLHSNPLNQRQLNSTLRRAPAVFGISFLLIIVGASFALTPFAQTRYDLQSKQRSNVSKEEELRLRKDRKKIDVREEYFRIQSAAGQDWEPKRIERPKGVPDWGVPPTEPPPSTEGSEK